ncbi:hypothetical protein N0V87_007863 [Didymella glomerata]|uniref:Uncharacterized protein n=1 Tax=Didymella glomerata TaxID=749621 RepID=A0A9W8WUN8_9PLEO|nr:hypothetical protein N0V87_007863 [Didymella glomerata]
MPVEHSLPFNRNLLITTPDSIHLRTPAGDKTVFECQSADGIVNACAAPNNSSLLAIADSHGVTLHDTAQPREKKHKLKGGGHAPRLLLFSPDSPGDHETTFKGFETLIAVGTQAGKVLIYDVLGLLIHEIVMNKPVRVVEWVGDMSVPSILPTMESPLSPQPGPVIKKLMEGVGEIEEEPVQGERGEAVASDEQEAQAGGRLSSPNGRGLFLTRLLEQSILSVEVSRVSQPLKSARWRRRCRNSASEPGQWTKKEL